jgi:hypothetical protein
MILMEQLKYSERKLAHHHSVYNKSNMDLPGDEPRPPRLVSEYLRHGIEFVYSVRCVVRE